jgi:hypothetical protein
MGQTGINFKEEAGIEPREMFDQVTLGMRMDGGPQPLVTMVTLSRVPFDRSKIMGREQRGFTKTKAFGRTYFKSNAQGQAVYVPNKRNWVMTSLPEAKLEPVLTSDGKTVHLTGPTAELARKLSANHLWFVMSADSLRQLSQGGGPGMPGMPGGQEMTQALQQAKAVALWATVQGGKVQVSAGVECADAGAAQQMTAKMQADGPKQMQGLGAMAAFMPGLPASVKTLVDEAKNSLAYNTDGTMAVMSLQLSVATLEGLFGDLAKMGPGMGGPPRVGGPPGGMPGQGPGGQPPGAPPGAPSRPRGGRGKGGGGRP